jgi:hypothetical protein
MGVSHVIHYGLQKWSFPLSITQFSFEQAVDVWVRRFNGQFQHEIAAAYVINVRAVNHVLKEKAHIGSRQVAEARMCPTP